MTTRLWPVDAVAGAPQYSGRALRQALMAPLLPGATAARPLGAQSGVRPGTPSTTVSVASMTWSVAPHAGVLDVETALESGPYGYSIDAAVTGAVTAAHATYTRWDGIYVQLSDPAESDGTSTPGVAVVYVAGTPSAAPAMPAQPSRSLLLARIVVPQSGGGSPSVVWLAPTADIGQTPRLAATADMPSPVVGQACMVGATEYRCLTAGTWTVWSQPWQAYTPTWNGVTLGNGASNGQWAIIGGQVFWRAQLSVGSTTTFTGGAFVHPSLPTGVSVAISESGSGYLFDTSAAVWQTCLLVLGSHILTPTSGRVTGAVPWTWAAGDAIRVGGNYQPV